MLLNNLKKLSTFLFFFLFSCATIVNGPTQKIAVYSIPSSADVWIDGNFEGQTPLQARLSRSEDHLLKIELPGYEPYTARITRSLSGWLIGNIVFGGIIGIVIDAVSGSMYKLNPEQINAHLRKIGAKATKGEECYLFVVAEPDTSWEKLEESLEPKSDRVFR